MLSMCLLAQQGIDDVDYKYDKLFLENLIQNHIDDFRKSKKLLPFKKDGILDAAAHDQSSYNLKTGSFAHKQNTEKKATPLKRVLFYDGMHEIVAENCYRIVVGSSVKVLNQFKKVKLKSYNSISKAIAYAWINSKEGAKILSNKTYANYGISVVLDNKTKVLSATHIVASEPFILPEGVKPMKGNFGIAPYDKKRCIEIDKKYSYLPYLMSDNFFYKNGEIYFYFHDLILFNKILKESGDGIALDIISRNQYKCEAGNTAYPSKVHKGIMLEPISKAQIFSKNELKETNELEVSLGPIPPYVDTNNVEFNLLILKNKCLCQTITYNNLGGENLQSLDLKPMLDTLAVSGRADSVLNQLNFTIPFELNKTAYNTADVKPFLDSLSLNRFDLKNIEIIAYSSIDGNIKSNKIIQQKRANSILDAIKKYKLQNVETKIITKENFDGFYESIKGSPYESKIMELSKEELREYVNSDTLKLNLEPYLAGQRKADITLTVEKVFLDKSLFNVLPQWFDKALAEKDYAKAKIYQSVMLKNIKNGNIDKDKIIGLKIPHSKETIPFINNQIALRWYYSEAKNKDSLNNYLLNEIDRQLVIDSENGFLRYNKTMLRLLLWSKKHSTEANPKELLRDIRALGNTNIEQWMINRLILNYNLISADYYYEIQKFKEREKALKNVKTALLSSNLDRDQSLKIGNYFIFQLQIDWAIDLMKPFAIKKNVDEEFLYTFLTVAIYNKEKVNDQEFLALMKKAKELNKTRFCKLFGSPNMSFQNLKNVDVKSLYCKSCN